MSTLTALKRTAMVAGAFALAAACSSATPTTTPVDAGAADVVVPTLPSFRGKVSITNELDLRTTMRQVWTEDVAWMRTYLIVAIAGLPETSLTAQHVIGNQGHIGDAIRPFYGEAAGAELTVLMQKHIQGIGAVVAAAKSGDPIALAEAQKSWSTNADDIARLLASLNPNWSLTDLTNHLHAHLDFTLAEVQARLAGNWAADVFAYDAAETHIVTFGDFLTVGLMTQFRGVIAPSPISSRDEDLHVAMHKLWDEHLLWSHVYLLDQMANLPDVSNAAARLLKNATDIGNAMKPYYGEELGDELASLLHDHLTGETAVLVALESGDDEAITAAKTAWYANADRIAQLLASKNPYWPLADAQAFVHQLLDRTVSEVKARLIQNWQWDFIFYEAIDLNLIDLSDFLAGGIAQQFPQPPPR